MSIPLNILSIDIDAALRKLTEKRFKSIDDPAIVLIRFAAAGTPKGIRIQLTNRSLDIETTGQRVDPALFHHLATLLDTTESKEGRAGALSHLEQVVGLDILAAFAGAPSRVTFSWQTESGAEGIRFVPGEPPEPFSSTFPGDLTIRIRGGLPAKADPVKIAEKCRFSQVPIIINGHLASRGIKVEGSLIRQKITDSDLVGVVGIPKEGDLSQITLLDNGIITDELYMPAQGGLVFHATVFGKRSDFQEIYPELRNAAKRLLAPLANGYPSLSAKRQKLAEVRLFDRYEVTRENMLVKGVDAFKTVDGASLDLPALLESAKAGNLFAIDEDAAAASFAVKNRRVVIVSRRQRRFLDVLLDAPVKTPPKRIVPHAKPTRFRERIAGLLSRMRGAGDIIPREALTDVERRFLDILNAAAKTANTPFTLEMSDGTAFPPRTKKTAGVFCYLVPRRHPKVLAMIADVVVNPAYVPPALTLLAGASDTARDFPYDQHIK